ncbi:hypothetical protein AAVH_43758 [Aphelenchoides avenae]|nr:hypothetical protein AAVH_43758 [Aphelenchus avenae]
MEIDVPRVMRDALFDDRLKFWDSIAMTYGFDAVSGKRVDRKVDRKPVENRKGSAAEPICRPMPKPELGTRPPIATSFSDRVPRERVSDYSSRQYVPSASHRSVGYKSWLGATAGGSSAYATGLVDRPRSRTTERRRDVDYRRSPSPSAGYYGNYYSSYLTK